MNAVVLEPQGFESYAVRDTDGSLRGFIAWSRVHTRWHVFDRAGQFVSAAYSRTSATEIVTNGVNL
jgi:hypothetical protein